MKDIYRIAGSAIVILVVWIVARFIVRQIQHAADKRADMKYRVIKAVHIYKTKKDYKIVTNYRKEFSYSISSEPIFILPVDAQSQDLADKLFEALNASRTIKESEEDKFWLGNALLKKLNESSFKKLYESSVSCAVLFDNGVIKIVPYKYLVKDKYLVEDGDGPVQIEFDDTNRLEVVEKVKEVLNNIELKIV